MFNIHQSHAISVYCVTYEWLGIKQSANIFASVSAHAQDVCPSTGNNRELLICLRLFFGLTDRKGEINV
jgi:hypothetical protein